MDYGSVCSGIEAATAAWLPLGWRARFFAEVEPFPAAVLCHRHGATRPLRPLEPDGAEDLKERRLREGWKRQLSGLPDGGAIPNLGDFTKINKDDYEGDIDLLVGGTPCQSYSLAGLRKGLADPQGNLALEFVRLAYRTDARWTVWENVPGVLSSGKGRDFASFISLLCGWEVPIPAKGWGNCGIVTNAAGCYGLAWRILDAQYTRVPMFPRAIPQRRRRVFVVGYRGGAVGSPLDWTHPAKVLFDGEMRERDTPPRRAAAQGTAPAASGGAEEAGERGIGSPAPRGMRPGAPRDDAASAAAAAGARRLRCVVDMRQLEAGAGNEASPTLIATDYKGGKAVVEEPATVRRGNRGHGSRLAEGMGAAGDNQPSVRKAGCSFPNQLGFIKNDAGGGQDGYWEEVFPTVRSQVIPAVAQRECFNITPCDANGTRSDRPGGGLYVTTADASKTLTRGGPNTETVVIEPPAISLDGDKMGKAERTGGSGLGMNTGDVMYTQTAKDVHAVAYGASPDVGSERPAAEGPACRPGPPLRATVRRLLPVETERLMGFPDDYTKIPWKGKLPGECPDAPRYKACGNSMCVNVMHWLGLRIDAVEREVRDGQRKAERA